MKRAPWFGTALASCAALCAAPALAQSGTLTTTLTGTTGAAGAMFDITAINAIEITGFEYLSRATNVPPGTMQEIAVYYTTDRSSFVGREGMPWAWTLLETVQVPLSPRPTTTNVSLSVPLAIQPGETIGIYFTRTDGASLENITYTNGLLGAVVTADTIFENRGVGKNYPFAENYDPRIWNGRIHYNVIAAAATGACCLPDGSCEARAEALCRHEGGIYRGDGTACATGTCPTGGCCFDDGTCEVLSEAGCALQNGMYRGDLSDCTSPCAQPGACCLYDSCIVRSERQCGAASGAYRGHGTVCATANCQPGDGTLLPLPNHLRNFSMQTTRGFWFTAPVDLVIAGVRAPDLVNHGKQNIEVIRLDVPPPAWPTMSAQFASLGRWVGQPAGYVLPVNIPVQAGEMIGILGAAGDEGVLHHSYAGAPHIYPSSIAGFPTDLQHIGTEFNVVRRPVQDIWTMNAPLSRIEVFYSLGPPPCYADCDGNSALNIDDFVCFINEFAIAQSLPPAQQTAHYANCDGSTAEPVLTIDDFLCFINEFAQGCP